MNPTRPTKLGRGVSRYYFPSICFILSSYHMYKLTVMYLAYETALNTSIFWPVRSPIRTFDVCIRYTDILDYNRIRKDDHTRDWFYTESHEKVEQYQHELFIDEIFMYTPNASEFIKTVKYRKYESFIMQRCDGEECQGLFNVGKSLHNEFMCYSIRWSNQQSKWVWFSTLSDTPDDGGEIMRIVPSEKFALAKLIKIFTHDHGKRHLSDSKASVQCKNRQVSIQCIRCLIFTILQSET